MTGYRSRMIDLDLAGISTPDLTALHQQVHQVGGDDVWHAQLRATGRVECDWPDTITIAGEGITIKTEDRAWILSTGEELHLTPTQAAIFTPSVWDADVIKAAEDRYTLAAWYIPNKVDAHGEWTDPDTLQKAAWGYVQAGDRRIRLQHDTSIVAGEWVEIMSWPQPVTMQKASGQTVEYPAGTVFMGVKWEPWAWELVKAGKVTGMSIGGTATRAPINVT